MIVNIQKQIKVKHYISGIRNIFSKKKNFQFKFEQEEIIPKLSNEIVQNPIYYLYKYIHNDGSTFTCTDTSVENCRKRLAEWASKKHNS